MVITLGSHLTVNTCIRSPRHTSYFYTMSGVRYISIKLGGTLKKQNGQGCRYDFCCATPGAEEKHLVYSFHLSFVVDSIAGPVEVSWQAEPADFSPPLALAHQRSAHFSVLVFIGTCSGVGGWEAGVALGGSG